ncbi:hypothetical protein AAHA92_21558 [Salvia divinorum]|uniref:Uncharacterized protein n=1 Tax=Salvia divinorum TaxID=28513 RepID=A0ABD1GNW2_SALDI
MTPVRLAANNIDSRHINISKDSQDSYNVYNVPNQVDSGVGGTDFSADPTCHSKTTPRPQQDSLSIPNESTNQSMHTSQQSKKNGKKRIAPSDSVGLIETLKKMWEDINLWLDKLTSRIGFEVDIDVAEIILDKVKSIELFMCLSEASRPMYVLQVLEKYG